MEIDKYFPEGEMASDSTEKLAGMEYLNAVMWVILFFEEITWMSR